MITKIKKALIGITAISLCLCAAGCGDKNKDEKTPQSGSYTAVITVKDYGDITLTLDGDTAPISVENFVKLARDGYYDGTTFHRIIEGFMIQGGNNPSKRAETIKGEFSANGVENNIKHLRGVISMARSTNKDSASAQFFIVHETSPHLDGNYAAFGNVVSGMEIVDEIAKNTPVTDGNGSVAAENQPVIVSVVISE